MAKEQRDKRGRFVSTTQTCDEEQPPTERWELVSKGRFGETVRLRVPAGWIYQSFGRIPNVGSPVLAMVFVPDGRAE
jgi:hypothetical protein